MGRVVGLEGGCGACWAKPLVAKMATIMRRFIKANISDSASMGPDRFYRWSDDRSDEPENAAL